MAAAAAKSKHAAFAEVDRELVGCSVFICFDRKDQAFTKNIYDALAVDDRNIWVDWADDEIRKGIEQSDVFMFVLSPDSIANKTCNGELEHAVTHCKRIIPIVCRDVDYRLAPHSLAERNWIFFRQDGDDFNAAMKLLLKAMDVDLRHCRYHTKLLTRAIDCERTKSSSLLLKGDDLKRAKHWLSACALGKEPKASILILNFITSSGAGLFSRGDALFAAPAPDAHYTELAAREARQRDELISLRARLVSETKAPTASPTGKSAPELPTPVVPSASDEVSALRAQLAEMKASNDRVIAETCDKRARELTTLLLNQFNARLKKETEDRDQQIASLQKLLADARGSSSTSSSFGGDTVTAPGGPSVVSDAPPSYQP